MPTWHRFAYPAILLALCAFLYLPRLGYIPLEDFDEAYYSEGAREMLARGDLGTPYYNGQPFLLKPILIYWLIAASFRLFGITEFAARISSAFLGAAIVLLTYWFCSKVLNRRAGFFAGIALAINYMWIDIARDASIDIPLTAALTLGMFLFFFASQAPLSGADFQIRRKRWFYFAAYALFGVALLAKGPVPTMVVVTGLLIYLIAARKLRVFLAEAQLLPGMIVLFVVAGPWYWYEIKHQPAFFSTFFIGEHFGHIGGELARQEPWWGNFKYVLIYFFPWAAFLPAALVLALRQQDRGHVLRLTAWWAIAVVLLFSIPRSKLAHYLAPAFPAMAILIGAWFDAWLREQPVNQILTRIGLWLLGVVAVVCAALAGVALVMPPAIREMVTHKYGDWSPGLAPVVILSALAIGFLTALAAARWKRIWIVPSLAGAMLVAGFIHAIWFKPHLSLIQSQPRKELAQIAARESPLSEPFGVYYAKRNATIFYARRNIVDLGEREDEFAGLVHFLNSPKPATTLTHIRFLPRLQQHCPRIFVRARRADFIFVSNHIE